MESNSQDICWLSIFLQFIYLFIYSSTSMRLQLLQPSRSFNHLFLVDTFTGEFIVTIICNLNL